MSAFQHAHEGAKDPFALFALIAAEKGWEYEESESYLNVLDCSIPSKFGTYKTHVAYQQERQLLRVVISLQITQPSPMIINELYRLVNAINDQVYYGVLTYGHDEERDHHYILYSGNLLLGDTGVSKEQLELHLNHLLEDYDDILPAWYTFLGAKPVVTHTTDGVTTGFRPGASVEDCLEMIETGHYGRA